MSTAEACPSCGLTFVDGKRTFSTFGRPTVTLQQHLADHEAEERRAAELRAAAARINALPDVLVHLPEDDGGSLDQPAENDASIKLRILAPSGTTGATPALSPNGLRMLHLYELPLPTTEDLAAHARKFGAKGVQMTKRAEEPLAGTLARRSAERDLQVKSRRRSRRRVGVKDQVRGLLERQPKLIPTVVADQLNISDKRAKKLISELRAEGVSG